MPYRISLMPDNLFCVKLIGPIQFKIRSGYADAPRMCFYISCMAYCIQQIFCGGEGNDLQTEEKRHNYIKINETKCERERGIKEAEERTSESESACKIVIVKEGKKIRGNCMNRRIIIRARTNKYTTEATSQKYCMEWVNRLCGTALIHHSDFEWGG